jgi:ribonuclease P protein component
MRKSLTRKERLKTHAELSRVFDSPDRQSDCRGAKLVARQNNQEHNRFAVAMVRKFGNAVKRNYSRRVLKEIYRNVKQEIQGNYDIVVVLYPGNYGYHEREQQFMTLIRRAGFVQTSI